MKKFALLTMILSLAALSCSKAEKENPAKDGVISFETVSANTRTVLSGTSVNWLATDAIKVFNAEGPQSNGESLCRV